MSECFEDIKKKLVENISVKTKELRQMSTSMEKMGIFSGCSESQKKQYSDLLKEISISSQGLEQFISISHGV